MSNEGWMAEEPTSCRVHHYVRNGTSLCITKRELFAAMIFHGMMANPCRCAQAEHAVEQADALIAALEKEPVK